MEYFDIVNEEGVVIGRKSRKECHQNPDLLHRSVHVLVFNKKGDLFLQKRAQDKDIQPGKWDTSVGGHLATGETCEEAVKREMAEELGIEEAELIHLYDYVWQTQVESELVRTYTCVYEGPIVLDRGEIEEGRFWSLQEISSNLGSGCFTPNFEEELKKWLQLQAQQERALHG